MVGLFQFYFQRIFVVELFFETQVKKYSKADFQTYFPWETNYTRKKNGNRNVLIIFPDGKRNQSKHF